MFKRIPSFFSLVKISHTVFSMPFAVIGFFLALKHMDRSFELKTFLLMLLCVLFARNAAMSFNRIVDRHIDKKNPRTQNRDIPAGKIKISHAYIFLVVNIVLFITTTYFLNILCFCLSPVALAIVLGYSYTKRFTYLSHFILGVGLSIAPVGAYLAVTAHFHLLPVLYSIAVMFWVSGFDIIYSLNDRLFDKNEGLHSVPARFGIKKSLIISAVLHIFTVVLIMCAGILNQNGIWFWIGAVLFAFLLFYQHIIVKPGDLSRVNMAFATLNGLSGLVLGMFFILDFYL